MAGSKKIYSGDQATAIFIFGIVCGLIIAFLFSLPLGGEQHFKITRDSVEVGHILLWHENLTDAYNLNKPTTKIGGWESIPKKDISIEMLDKHCELEKPRCNYIFDKTKRFEIKDEESIAKTYEGLIWYEQQKDGSEIVFYCPSNKNCFKQFCQKPTEYICGDSLVWVGV